MRRMLFSFFFIYLLVPSVAFSAISSRQDELDTYGTRDYYGKTGGTRAAFYASEASKTSSLPLEIGDKLYIEVYREPELSGFYSIDMKGNFNYPLVGQIRAAGLTQDEFRKSLIDALSKDFLVNPQIKIEFQESRAMTTAVLGQVSKPGNYVLSDNMTLLRMISEAGGFTPEASEESIQVIRTDQNGSKGFILANALEIVSGKAPDIEIKPGDVVFVEKKDSLVGAVSILGQVKKPGNYDFVPDLTVVKLLSEAQGFTEMANPKSVKISRLMDNGKRENFKINFRDVMKGDSEDIKLEPGDVVFVPETVF
ncbi:MAG: hypothetical protein A3C35_08330 [Omnitrophica bacterium RIFCSPHIGHO2_02_FULL_46_11]|nr:MAG: hypothetical protein A3A81_02230 [Omnitrophica bacterium RIFCSPLOWO2_01_FULL_45_10b]OGW86551.1 MAG: hypothetical protein A3C35_08330 [Omnitrophica bacterium RIFCSPHIGHO2_02_FULL_46_11]